MIDPFHSSKYTLARAKYHINDFERQYIEFFKTDPYKPVIESDPNTGEKVHKLKLTKPIPHAFPGIAADAINNLRSALDQACYAVATGNKKRTAFPFANTAAELENVIKRGSIHLPDEIVDLLRTFQPYKGGNNLLWALNKLCNANKHGSVCFTFTVSVGAILNRTTVSGKDSFIERDLVWDRVKDEMELFRVAPGVTSKPDFNVTLLIALCDVEFVNFNPAPAVLNEFARIVEGVLVTIEAETRRLRLL